MENSLLTYEARHLRARLQAAERAAKQARGRIGALEKKNSNVEQKLREANERLRAERGRTRDLNAQLKDLRTKRQRLASELTEVEAKAQAGQVAAADLAWLIDRLDRSPLGPLFRRRAGFRTLLDRYGASADRP